MCCKRSNLLTKSMMKNRMNYLMPVMPVMAVIAVGSSVVCAAVPVAKSETALKNTRSDHVSRGVDFEWMHDLKKARAKAKAQQKPLFVMFRCEP